MPEERLPDELDSVARTRHRVNSGTEVGRRRRINWSTDFAVTDDPLDEEVNVSLSGGGGGGGDSLWEEVAGELHPISDPTDFAVTASGTAVLNVPDVKFVEGAGPFTDEAEITISNGGWTTLDLWSGPVGVGILTDQEVPGAENAHVDVHPFGGGGNPARVQCRINQSQGAVVQVWQGDPQTIHLINVTAVDLSTLFAINKDGDIVTARSTAASGPVGAVARKLEIFDESGTSLGFIPIYSSIT